MLSNILTSFFTIRPFIVNQWDATIAFSFGARFIIVFNKLWFKYFKMTSLEGKCDRRDRLNEPSANQLPVANQKK